MHHATFQRRQSYRFHNLEFHEATTAEGRIVLSYCVIILNIFIKCLIIRNQIQSTKNKRVRDRSRRCNIFCFVVRNVSVEKESKEGWCWCWHCSNNNICLWNKNQMVLIEIKKKKWNCAHAQTHKHIIMSLFNDFQNSSGSKRKNAVYWNSGKNWHCLKNWNMVLKVLTHIRQKELTFSTNLSGFWAIMTGAIHSHYHIASTTRKEAPGFPLVLI